MFSCEFCEISKNNFSRNCKGFDAKNGLKVKQLAKQPSTLKTLMQKILVGL